MSLHASARWIVCYDIREPRRGVRVHRFLKDHGVPLQYSVFAVQASAAQLHQMMRSLERLIDPRADDVRAYRVPVRGETFSLGQPMLPEGVLLEAAEPAPHHRTATQPQC